MRGRAGLCARPTTRCGLPCLIAIDCVVTAAESVSPWRRPRPVRRVVGEDVDLDLDSRRNTSRTPPNIRGRASISAVSALRQKSTPLAGLGPGGAPGGRGREAAGEGPRRRPGSRQQAAGFTPACSRGPAPPWAPGCSAEGPPRGCGGRARGGAAAARPRRRAPWPPRSLPEDGEGGRREGRGQPSSRPPPPPGAPRWRSCAAGGSGGPATTERGSGGLTDRRPARQRPRGWRRPGRAAGGRGPADTAAAEHAAAAGPGDGGGAGRWDGRLVPRAAELHRRGRWVAGVCTHPARGRPTDRTPKRSSSTSTARAR